LIRCSLKNSSQSAEVAGRGNARSDGQKQTLPQ
jgi:hypothetical protein